MPPHSSESSTPGRESWNGVASAEPQGSACHATEPGSADGICLFPRLALLSIPGRATREPFRVRTRAAIFARAGMRRNIFECVCQHAFTDCPRAFDTDWRGHR